MTTLTYTGVSEETYNALLTELEKSGGKLTPTTEGYHVEAHNVSAVVSYDAAKSVATVDIISKPFYVTIAEIDSGIWKCLGVK
jgi:hypothetical protein